MPVDQQQNIDSPLPRDRVRVFADHDRLGEAAAGVAATAISRAVEQRGACVMMLAAAPSQAPLLRHLATRDDVPWAQVSLFHMDEYLGLAEDAPQGFGNWLLGHLGGLGWQRFERIRPLADPRQEQERYASLLREAGRLDVTCMGVGVNGHLAFNEPDQARLDDPEPVRVTDLDLASRQQQVDEGLFPSLDDVPAQALTVTVPALLNTGVCVMTALGPAKAAAVARMLYGPIDNTCPAAAIRRHPDVNVYLDEGAASELTNPGR